MLCFFNVLVRMKLYFHSAESLLVNISAYQKNVLETFSKNYLNLKLF